MQTAKEAALAYLRRKTDQNINLLAALQEEAQHSFEERKRNAREEGERAGTRLLLPMMMMLAVVMVLILVPACFSFAGM